MGFGSGLALQDKWPQQNFGRDNWLYGQKKRLAKDKAAGQDQKDSEKYLNSIQVELGRGKIHPRRFEVGQKVMADVLTAAEQAQMEAQGSGQNWRTNQNFQRKLAEARMAMQQIHSLSQEDFQMEDQVVKDLQAGTADEETAMAFLNASKAGDNKAIGAINDPFEYVKHGQTPIGNYPTTSIQPYQKIDLPKIIGQKLTDPKNMTWIQTIAQNQGLPANVRGALSESGLPNTQEEAKILQKQLGYKETPTSVESITNAAIEDHPREMERMVRADAKKLAEAAGEDYMALDKDARKEYVKAAALQRAIPQKGMKITEKMFKMPAPPRPTQADKDKQWQSEGNSFFNAKNKITVSDVKTTDLGKVAGIPANMKSFLPKEILAIAEAPNGKVLSFSHTDVMENKPLVFTNQTGQPLNGIPKAVIGDNANPERFDKNAWIILAINDPESKTGLKYSAVQYNAANKDVLKNEYGKTAEEVLAAVSGKTGTVSDGGEVRSTRKSSGQSTSGFEEFTVSGKKYRIPKDKVAEFKKDNGLDKEEKPSNKETATAGALHFDFSDDWTAQKRIDFLKNNFGGDAEVYVTDSNKDKPTRFRIFLNSEVGKYKAGQYITIY